MRIPKSAKKSAASLSKWLRNKSKKHSLKRRHKKATVRQLRALAKARRVRLSHLRTRKHRGPGHPRKLGSRSKRSRKIGNRRAIRRIHRATPKQLRALVKARKIRKIIYGY